MAFGDPEADKEGYGQGPDFGGLADAVSQAVRGVDAQGQPMDIGQSTASLADALNMSINAGYGLGIPGQMANIAKNHPQGLLGVIGQVQSGLTPGMMQNYNFTENLGNIISGNLKNFQVKDLSKKGMRQALATDVISGLLGANPNAISIKEAMDFATVANFVNPMDKNTTLNYDSKGNLIGFTEAPIESFGVGTNVTFDKNLPYGYQGATFEDDSALSPFGIDTKNINYNPYGWGVNYDPTKVSPVKDLIFGVDRTQQSPTIELQQNKSWDYNPFDDTSYKSIFEGVNVEAMDNAILNLDRAFASNYDNPAAQNQAVIDALGKVSADTVAVSRAGGDPRQAAAQREIAKKAAEQLIIQEAARNNNIANIPVAEGPAVNVKITKARKRPTRGKEAANYIDPGPSPAQIAAASLVADQTQFKKLPKSIQKELRSGRQPTGSDYQVDRAMAIINPPKPSSPMDSRGR